MVVLRLGVVATVVVALAVLNVVGCDEEELGGEKTKV